MSRRAWVLFAAVGVIWGVPFLLIKVADGGVSVAFLVFVRVCVGALLLLPLAVRRGRLRGWAGLAIGLGGVTLLLRPAVSGGGAVPVLATRRGSQPMTANDTSLAGIRPAEADQGCA